MLAFVGVIAAIQAVLTRMWIRPAALTLLVILIGAAVLAIFGVEAISRRNVVEVSGGRIRWTFRQPPVKGDQALSDLRNVEVFPSGARLVFEQDVVFASRAVFRRRDIRRFVERVRGLGAQVSDMGSPRP